METVLGEWCVGVLIGLALIVLLKEREDFESGEGWSAKEVSIALVALAVGVGGAAVMVLV